jgi:pimeloyl-ACP methyl ester carboxylesterase
MNKKTKKLLLIFDVVLMVLMIVGTQFVLTVGAKKSTVTYYPNDEYTQIIGKLGGADYELLIPDDWNGMLIVGCRGYTHELPTIPFPYVDSPMHGTGLYFMGATEFPVPPGSKFAYAWSNYGVGGICIKEGMIRIHQLTEYIIDNYDVTGKVFLHGYSLGGLIACLLGENYPNLYDGIIDVCGPKDMASMYYYKKAVADLTTANKIRTYLNGPPANMPPSFTTSIPDPMLLQFRMFQGVSLADMEMACGGTPDTKPKAYERWSATYHADITIPVISLIGELDFTVVTLQFDMYYDAVEEAGCLDYYRSYTITGGGHCDLPLISAMSQKFFVELVPWVVFGIAPPYTPPPIP